MSDAKDIKGKTGLRRLINAFSYSKDGFAAAYGSEEAFRQEFWLLIIGAIVAIVLPVTLLQTVCLIAVLLFLLIVEILNSAIEATVDRIGAEIHPLSKRAKDMGSCAVLMACALAALVWIAVLADCFLN